MESGPQLTVAGRFLIGKQPSQRIPERDAAARQLHALVDGLSLQGLAGHLTQAEMTAQLDVFLCELITG
ncbi:hypothetical protein ABZ942_27015 [Nocardia sp. NPDC046473]|uniref:hypothetical protein n=1 Tax=Nocardia sp. NPDC046473 TaxID=3155733 RepID=UPI0033DFFB04